MFNVLLFTGGAGSGKTSTAEAWAASRLGLAAHLSHDAFHHFVKSGVISPADGPTDEAERQWRIAIDVCVAACRIYVDAGISCAIDTFLLPASIPLWIGLRDLRVGLVVLHPDVEVAVRRNATRLHEVNWGVPEWQVRANHQAMRAWMHREDALVIDNSDMSVKQVLSVIEERESDDVIRPVAWTDGMQDSPCAHG